jgi:deazaflavin-dependent oxidoreductase (nitroreductase family)
MAGNPMNDFNQNIIKEFRENAGVVGGPFAGMPVVLLTTTGAKSGQTRTNPLVSLVEDGRVYVVASMGGAPKHPAWYHNLVANPVVTVERGTDRYEATARVTTGEERDRLYALQASRIPTFGDYQKKTTRQIPVIELVRT